MTVRRDVKNNEEVARSRQTRDLEGDLVESEEARDIEFSKSDR